MTALRIDPIPEGQISGSPDEGGLGALRTERGNLPLRRLDVRAAITGLVAGIELTQDFHNTYDVPLEATYVFPLPPRAALTSMTMTVGDRVIEGVLRERAEARAAYQRAIEAGQRAGIAEEERPDVFTLRVGNILPGERATVSLTLAGPLSLVDGQAEFRFPLVVAPRYIPGVPLPGDHVGDGYAPDTDQVPDASRITPPVLLPGFPNPVALSLEVRVDPAGLPLHAVASSLHAVSETDGVIAIRPGERVDRDFVLRLSYGDDAVHDSLVLVPDATGDEGTYQLTVLPARLSAPARPRDVVLVLDRSGSMGGWKMVAARRAAARIIDTLTDADRFAVFTFDNVVERPDGLPEGLVPGTDRNRYRAVEHLARTRARGGTEMLTPLRAALALLGATTDRVGEEARDRVVVLVTDGQVGNEDHILGQTATQLERVRVHVVGIDRSVNAGFLGRLASAGAGRCELVESEDRLDDAMDHIHRRIATPLVTDLAIVPEGWELVPDTAAPGRVRHLFVGVPLVVTGRYRGPATGSVALRGLGADGATWVRTVVASAADSPAVPVLWARAHLGDLQDRYAITGDARLEQRIVATSLRFGVLCRFTAYVAIDSRAVTSGTAPHRVTQPVEPPSGWEMPAGPGPVPLMASMSLPPTAPGAAPRMGGVARGFFRRTASAAERIAASAAGPAPAGPPSGPGEHPPRPAGAVLRGVAAAEASRLREAAGAPGLRRAELLEDLASRLDALAVYLDPQDAALAARVRAIGRALRDDAVPVAQRWERAVRDMDELAGGTPPQPPAGRGTFWKR